MRVVLRLYFGYFEKVFFNIKKKIKYFDFFYSVKKIKKYIITKKKVKNELSKIWKQTAFNIKWKKKNQTPSKI